MAKYQVIVDLDVDTDNLEVAYRAAEKLIKLGAAAAGIAAPVLTVAVADLPKPRTGTDFTVTVGCGPTRPKASVQIAFQPAARRGAVIVWDDGMAEPELHTYPLTPSGLQWLVRGLWTWPMDLLDDMAREDELARRRAGGGQ